MSYKSILVHVDPSPETDRRVKLAMRVAEIFDGKVTGLGAEAFDPVVSSGYAPADGAVLEAVRQRIALDLPAAERRFHALTGGRKGDLWMACEDYPAKMLALESRGADLIVAGRPTHGAGSTFAAKPSELIMEAGGPVLLTADNDAVFSGERVIVAWKDSRESRRALADSMPFLMRAQRVIVLGVCGDANTIVDQGGMKDVVRRLFRHGVDAVLEVVPRGKGTVADAIESTAIRHSADLIVTGAYGHSRLREWALGGVTEDFIAASSKFVLFSHQVGCNRKDHIGKAFKRSAELEALGINVSAEGGKVSLSGTIHNWSDRRAAENAAWAMPSVTQVVDNLTVA